MSWNNKEEIETTCVVQQCRRSNSAKLSELYICSYELFSLNDQCYYFPKY